MPRLGSYHPDELLIISAASIVDFGSLQLNPQFYNYPSLFIYVISLVFSVLEGWGLLATGEIAVLYLSARMISAVFGAATIYMVFLAGKRFYGEAAGLIAAGVLAIMPLHVQHSHFVAVDVPSVFFLTAALGASVLLLRDRRMRVFILAGVLSGLAAGTKYNCGLIFASVIAAGLLSAKPEDSAALGIRQRIAPIGVAFLAAVAAFLLVTPGAILWTSQFLHGLTYELRHVATGHGYVFVNTGPGWLYTITSSLNHGLGWPLLLISLLSVIMAIARRRREDLIVLAFIVPYFVLISLSEVRFARYALPLLPPLAILTAGAVMDIRQRLRSRPKIRGMAAVGLGLVLLYTLTYSIALNSLFTQPDPRDRVADWAQDYLPEGTTIAFPTVPWFYSPPFAPGFGNLRADDRFDAMAESRYNLVADRSSDWNAELLREKLPEYVMISDYEKTDALRADAPGARRYMRAVEELHEPVAVFQSRFRPAIFGSVSALPHDMQYPAPKIEVYRIKWQR